MKTTVDIPDELLSEAMKNLGVNTKREAVVGALEELNRRRRAEKAVRMFGTFKNIVTQEELKQSRLVRGERHEKQWHGSR